MDNNNNGYNILVQSITNKFLNKRFTQNNCKLLYPKKKSSYLCHILFHLLKS